MGWNTWLSIGQKPLKGRQNLIVTARHYDEWDQKGFDLKEVMPHQDFETALDFAKHSGINKLFVVGGPSLLWEALPHADKAFVTIVHHVFEDVGEPIYVDEVLEEIKSTMVEVGNFPGVEITPERNISLSFLTFQKR